MGNEFIARKGLIALEDSRVTGLLTVSGSLKITGSVALNNIPNSSTANALYYNTTDGTVSYAAAGAGGNPFPFTGTAVISGSLQIVTSGSRAVVLPTGSAANYISQSLSQSAVVGATIYGMLIAPTFTNTTSSQTQTALRVSPTFTGSFSSSATNNIVDFGTSTIGSQFIINDITSGSIYQVNDSIGVPIIEATSDWIVNMYEGPTNVIFKKSGSAVYMTGSLFGTSSFAITASTLVGGIPTAFPYQGTAVISGSLQIVTSGSRGVIISASQAANYISQSLSQSATVGATIYGLSISPTFTNTTSSQTQTALRVSPTFTGSFSSSAVNNIVDFGTSTIGSQFIINDVTSGSIYQVNDVNGIPIIEATSDWVVNMYEGLANVIFKKSGSAVYMTGSLFGTASHAITASTLVGGIPTTFPYQGTAVISGSLQIVTSGSRAMVISASQASNYISQSLSQSATVGATIYGLSIAPSFTNTTSSQTQTALRVSPTFTGSFSSSATNNIVDFGTSTIGSQFIINDVTSGSIYQVNDSIGVPIIEATSDWVVNLYEGPTNVIFKKSGSGIYITGLLSMSTGSTFVFPLLTSSISPRPTGSAYFSGSFLHIWNGSRYVSSSFS